MIVGVFGLPRSGKSTLLAWAAYTALVRHRPLFIGRGAWRVSLGDFAPYQAVYSTFPILPTAPQKNDYYNPSKIAITFAAEKSKRKIWTTHLVKNCENTACIQVRF